MIAAVADIINLRQARKAKARGAAAEQAAENRARHGLSKSEKRLRDDEAARLGRRLDGAKREGGDDANG